MYRAVFLAIAQTVFVNKLSAGLGDLGLPNLDPATLLTSGATSLGAGLPPDQYKVFLELYSKSLTTSWYSAAATASFSIIGAVFVEHRRIKGKEKKKAEETPVIDEKLSKQGAQQQ